MRIPIYKVSLLFGMATAPLSIFWLNTSYSILLIAFIIMTILDFIFGIVLAMRNKRFSSKKAQYGAFNTIVKIIAMIVIFNLIYNGEHLMQGIDGKIWTAISLLLWVMATNIVLGEFISLWVNMFLLGMLRAPNEELFKKTHLTIISDTFASELKSKKEKEK